MRLFLLGLAGLAVAVASIRSALPLPLDDLIKTGVHGDKPDIAALASRDAHKLTVLVWHYHDDDLPGRSADVTLTLDKLPARPTRIQEFRIDADHSNAYTAWQKMGSPPQPTQAQYAQLEQAGQLTPLAAAPAIDFVMASKLEGSGAAPRSGTPAAARPTALTSNSGAERGTLRVALPRQAVALLVLEW